MSKAGNWIPIDKGFVRTLSKIDRPYTPLEAMFSFTYDVDCGREWTIKGYAKLWQWSRNKVRKFVAECRTQRGHSPDTKGTQSGHPVFFINQGLWREEDTKGTDRGHKEDTKPTPTSNPNPNPKEKTLRFNARLFLSERKVDKQHITDFLINRKTKRLSSTLTAFTTIEREAGKAKLTLSAAIEKCCDEGWGGFKASWVDGTGQRSASDDRQLKIELALTKDIRQRGKK